MFLNKGHGKGNRKASDKHERKNLIFYHSLEANEMSQRDMVEHMRVNTQSTENLAEESGR